MLILSLSAIAQDKASAAFERWYGDKYSMFIHFGIYSHLGGVWDGKPVTRGYSEQIQSHAGIYSDKYAAVAEQFDPRSFDAHEIVDLAQKAGMRSIVFTSKHHDGFCMFDTATTEYDSVDSTPSGRDYIRELSEACAAAGVKFGLYYSLIDWNYPHAYPISSHNADFVTPQHHEFNKAQVKELLSNYGPISELWFDMGALEPQQSRELYDLVKELQPDCMVSGRLGNDMYDFAVMPDNKLPDVALHAPWQSAASMFSRTWSYRSWQERGEVSAKVAEKLKTLIEVVSLGGNYLLNIGPDASGAVVPFEKEVLLKIGQWLEKNGDAIYDVKPSPFAEAFEWGDVTVKGQKMYLFLTGKYPEAGLIKLPLPWGEKIVKVTEQMFADPTDVAVVRLELDWEMHREVASIAADERISRKNATPDYSYSCFDYYSNYRSSVAYNWLIDSKKAVKGVKLEYALSDVGKRVKLQIGDREMEVTLGDDSLVALRGNVEILSSSYGRMRKNAFDDAVVLDRMEWKDVEPGTSLYDVKPFANYLMKSVLYASKPCRAHLSVTSGNGVELLEYDNQKEKYVSVMKHLNPYRSTSFNEEVILDLKKGENIILLRAYNRFERQQQMKLEISPEQSVCVQTLTFENPIYKEGKLPVRVSSLDNKSEHTDCGLHNLAIDLILN